MSEKFACPCCGYLTLATRGDYDICPVCFWEDDPLDELLSDGPSGANRSLTFEEARAYFRACGACHPDYQDKVREPLPEEVPAGV